MPMQQGISSANQLIASLEYPVLAFAQGTVFPKRSADEVTRCTKVALKKGYFSGQVLIDSAGTILKIKGARKLHGIGPFWGYNFFLNQRLRVELITEESPSSLDIDETKKKVLKALRGPLWNAGADVPELVLKVKNAKSIAEVARIVTDAYYGP